MPQPQGRYLLCRLTTLGLSSRRIWVRRQKRLHQHPIYVDSGENESRCELLNCRERDALNADFGFGFQPVCGGQFDEGGPVFCWDGEETGGEFEDVKSVNGEHERSVIRNQGTG